MLLEIPKGTSEKKIRQLLNKKTKKTTNNVVDSFFGKLPCLEDGLKIQKRLRNEWK